MIQIAPADPILRKIVLPSIIRISDARLRRTPSHYTKKILPRPLKREVTSHALRAVMRQLSLELK